MSLISGMNNMMNDPEAMEIAEEEMEYQDLLDAEADIVMEAMVGDEDTLDKMLDEDEETEEIEKEIEEEEGCCESAALTGMDFINSLLRDTDDPITTKPGSIGQQGSSANFPTNFHDEFIDDNDPLETKSGSVGPENSAANFSSNFHNELDFEDQFIAIQGSLGRSSATAKDPIMESIMGIQECLGLTENSKIMESAATFGELLGCEIATEGIKDVPNKIKGKMNDIKEKKRQKDLDLIGIGDIDCQKVDSMMADNQFDQAISYVNSWLDSLDQALNSSDRSKDVVKAGERLKKMGSSLVVSIQIQKLAAEEIERGVDPKQAMKNARKKIEGKKDKKKAEGTLDAASESYIDLALGFYSAMEETMNEDFGESGSIGQDTSSAHSSSNFSDGKLDQFNHRFDDDGSEGQQSSAATWGGNHSGGEHLDDDPNMTDNGSVGQKDSTAKDPASESVMTALEELENLAKSIDEEEFM